MIHTNRMLGLGGLFLLLGSHSWGTEVLGPSTLVTATIKGNTQIQASQAATREGEAKVRGAQSGAWPKLGLETRATALGNPADALTMEKGSFGSLTVNPLLDPVLLPSTDLVIQEAQDPLYYSAALSLDQPLWTWGKIDSLVDLREEELALTWIQGEKTQADVLAALYRALYNLAAQRQALALVREQEEIAGRMLVSLKASRDAGVTTALAWEEARVDAEQIAMSAGSLADTVAHLERTVLALAGYQDRDDVVVSTEDLQPVPVLPHLDVDAWQNLALAKSLDLAMLRKAEGIGSAALALSAAQAEGKPDLALNLRGGWNGSRLPFEEDWEDHGDWFLTLTVAAKGTLLDFGASSASMDERKSALRRQELQRTKAEDDLALSVAGLWESIQSQAATLAYLERRVAIRGERVRQEEVNRRAGTASEITVLRAQQDHLEAVLELSTARMRYTDGCISLLSAAMPEALHTGGPFFGQAD